MGLIPLNLVGYIHPKKANAMKLKTPFRFYSIIL